MVLTFDQISYIIKNNPNKDIIEYAQKQRKKLSHVVLGEDIDSYLKQSKYFENAEVFEERKGCLSNKDLFSRVLNRESMVFNARGGSVIFNGLNEDETRELNEYLSNIRKGYSVRRWIQIVAKKAYEVDPMGIIFIERTKDGEPYHTYKSSASIYDYKITGTSLEYVVFYLTNSQALEFDIIDSEVSDGRPNEKSKYYRVVDDENDYIVKYDKEIVSELQEIRLSHGFQSIPARIFSDIQDFRNTQYFQSQLDSVVELAEDYLYDRSVRRLTKKMHAYPKLVAPAVQCRICDGTGLIDGNKCSTCDGTGLTVPKSPAHTLKVPLDQASAAGFDITKIYTYIRNDIQTWDKQDNTIYDQENLIYDGFWGTENRKYTSGIKVNDMTVEETATKTLVNLQPIYERLSRTADWAEEVEKFIDTMIGKAMYDNLKDVIVKYGRDYILESSEELYERYLNAKLKGSPSFVLNDCLELYFHSLYANNPLELSVALKMMKVEPFIHSTVPQCQQMAIAEEDLKAKTYFSEWYNLKTNNELFMSDVQTLIADLYKYSGEKEMQNDILHTQIQTKESIIQKKGIDDPE